MLKFIYIFYAPGYTQGYTLIREDQNMETLNHSCYDRRYELFHKVRSLYLHSSAGQPVCDNAAFCDNQHYRCDLHEAIETGHRLP